MSPVIVWAALAFAIVIAILMDLGLMRWLKRRRATQQELHQLSFNLTHSSELPGSDPAPTVENSPSATADPRLLSMMADPAGSPDTLILKDPAGSAPTVPSLEAPVLSPEAVAPPPEAPVPSPEAVAPPEPVLASEPAVSTAPSVQISEVQALTWAVPGGLSYSKRILAGVLSLIGIGLLTLALWQTDFDHVQGSVPGLAIGVGLFVIAVILAELSFTLPKLTFMDAVLDRLPLRPVRLAIERWLERQVYSRTVYQIFKLPGELSLRSTHLFLRWLRVTSFQFWMVVAALVLSGVVFGFAGDGSLAIQPALAVGAWLIAIVLAIAGTWNSDSDRPAHPQWTRLEIGLVAGLALLGLALRAFDTTHIPFILGGDEGTIGQASVPFATGEANNIFGATLASPSLYFFMQSLSIRLFGHTVAALRLSSVVAGALSVPVMYLLGRAMFGRLTAFFSAAYMAAFHFVVHFSRIALQNIWEVFFSAIVMAGVWLGWTHGRRSTFIWTGLMLGFAQFFFPGVRLLIMILPIWFFLAFLHDRKRMLARIPDLIVMVILSLVVFMPLLQYYVKHPEIYTEPLPRSFILSPDGPAHHHVFGGGATMAEVLRDQFSRALLGFTHIPINDWYTPGKPMLLALPAALFLIGLVYALFRIKDLRIELILLMLAADLVFGVALTTNPPTAQRLLMAVPSVVLLLVLPLERLVHWLSKLPLRWSFASYIPAMALLILAMALDVNFYFNIHTPSKQFRDANDEIANRIAQQLNQLSKYGSGWQMYCICPPRMGYWTHPIIQFLAPSAVGIDVMEPMTAPPDSVQPGQTLFVVLPERLGELALVESAYPGGVTTNEYYRNGDLLYTTYVTVVSPPTQGVPPSP